MNMGMRRFQLLLPEELWERLLSLAGGGSVGFLVRSLIEDGLKVEEVRGKLLDPAVSDDEVTSGTLRPGFDVKAKAIQKGPMTDQEFRERKIRAFLEEAKGLEDTPQQGMDPGIEQGQ
jgi:hypothetical protein